MRNVVLDGVKKTLETYYMEKSLKTLWKWKFRWKLRKFRWSLTAYFNIAKFALKVLQDDAIYTSKEAF